MRTEGFADPVRFQPLWWEDAPRPHPMPLPVRPHADVVVIGAGYAGLNAALTLARAGRETVVLDAEAPGWGASTRNGGQVGPGNQKFTVARLREMFGEQRARALFQEGLNAFDHIAGLIEREGIQCDFHRCGRFRGATRPRHYEAMARNMEEQYRFAGVEYFMVPRQDQRQEIDSDRFHGGSVLPGDASLHPGRYHDAVMHRAAAAGATILGWTPATRVETAGAGFAVHTPRGQIHAGNVIVTTNGHTGPATPGLRRRIVPVASAIIATEPLPAALVNRLMPRGRVYGESRRVFTYFRASPDGRRVVFGGRASHWADPYSASSYSHLRREMLATFPDLAPYLITHCWRGYIAYTFDQFPHIGRLDGIHYALGCNGTGVSRASYLGHKVALQVLGEPQGRTAFDDLPFPTHPLYHGVPWMVPMAEFTYRIRDRLDR